MPTERKLRKPTKNLTQTLASNVRQLRQRQGISQEELAARSGLHRTYVGSVERGERNVTLSSLESLAAALGVSARDLITHEPR